MENAIREGELRLLSSETLCDVVLSCQGCKLSAHKLILSIASPVLQELLLQDSADTTVLIFPDVDGKTMTLVLDYIYNGSVTVSSHNLPEFLSIATLLKLQLDYDCLDKEKHKDCSLSLKETATNMEILKEFPNSHCPQKCKNMNNDLEDCEEITHKKLLRKVPNLMPISSLQKGGVAARKGLYNRVFPSPWCPRVVPLLADPREECLITNEQLTTSHSTKENHIEENDTNNNFQIRPHLQPYFTSAIFKNTTYSGKGGKLLPHHRTNYSFPTAPHSPVVNSSSSSPVHTEADEEQKLQVFENSSVIYKHEAEKHNDPEAAHGPDVDLKAECKENALKDADSPRTSETDEEAVKKANKTDKHKPFKCHDCGKSFSQLRNYKYHRSIHEGTREFAARCPECGKVFNDRGYLSSHLKIHRDRKEYACPNCPKRFNQRVAYNMHLRIHTGVKPHECPTCGKTFSRKMLLKQHQRVHTGERPYSCPECGKSFADRSNMSLHARLHTGVKPYACNLCPKSFTKKHHLKTHMNFHTGLKPYSCQKCGLSFSQSSNMRTHYKKCILKSPSTSSICEHS